jgi:hypothetical protein
MLFRFLFTHLPPPSPPPPSAHTNHKSADQSAHQQFLSVVHKALYHVLEATFGGFVISKECNCSIKGGF